VLLEKGAVRRVLVDVAFVDVNPVLIQKTSGVAACSSGRLPVEGGLEHGRIVAMIETAHS